MPRGSWPDAGDIQAHPVQTALCAKVQRFAIRIAPRQVMRVLGSNDGAEVFSFSGENPQAAGTGHIEISLLVDFHPIQRVLAGELVMSKNSFPFFKVPSTCAS